MTDFVFFLALRLQAAEENCVTPPDELKSGWPHDNQSFFFSL